MTYILRHLKKDVRLLKFQVIVQILMVIHFLVYNIYLFNSKEEEDTKENQPIDPSITSTTHLNHKFFSEQDATMFMAKFPSEIRKKHSDLDFSKQEL